MVFVYGSLKQGFHNHCLLQSSTCMGAGQLHGNYTLLDLGAFPALVHTSGDATPRRIRGEIYNVSSDTLADLDCLEGHPDFYRRVRRLIHMENGTAVRCWVYLYPTPAPWEMCLHTVVHSGMWER